ncbi:unnamed protein product [Kuraishia capsulata CBS 1993]|uniref:AB hydrolase-1 domain-containing protein n=1 Tax=Kuraishia capsulata CBS 1993 TaxID=1382522 RepID=W6MV22_9ASCO|nr:uncharacterized protein KUCA_T00001991001 [Kuraishia capsulata CBS 1993]CDK26020.1 unnamed protein product [Kuraishia capsulata CBS 1993]
MIVTRSCFSRLFSRQFSQSATIDTVPLVFDKHAGPESPNAPIVFLHGLFGSRLNNRSVSKQLAKRLLRDVYCVDLRNHGDSPHNSRHDYPALAADVARFFEDHSLENPIVIGHSMGAKTAMALVLEHPRLCSMMIAVDNAPVDNSGYFGTGFSKFGKYARQMRIVEQRCHSSKEADAVLAQVEDSLPVRQFLMSNLKRKGDHYTSRVPLEILAKSLDNVGAFPFDPLYSRWTGPSLFVRGADSPYISDEMVVEIGKFFPNFEVRDVQGAGHWLISEKPKEFIDIVVEYIERIEDE